MSAPLRPVLSPDQPATVRTDGVADPAGWVASRRDELDSLLLEHGSVLVTGLPITSATDVAAVRDALGYSVAACPERFATRRDLADGVYSAPDWAADREQCLHHEQGYGIDFPRVLVMACLTAAETGGAMLLGDTRAALAHLPSELVERFRTEGWLLERNFRPHFGLPWTTAFGVDTTSGVEKLCADRLIGCEWLRDGALHTIQRRAALVHHPVTGQACWFNDVAFFSQWSVDRVEREVLLSAFGPDGIPFNTRFGGGGSISESDWRCILDAYDAVMRRVRWHPGDLLLVDNVLTAHGREPYTGSWEIAIAPADPLPLDRCRPTVPPLPDLAG